MARSSLHPSRSNILTTPLSVTDQVRKENKVDKQTQTDLSLTKWTSEIKLTSFSQNNQSEIYSAKPAHRHESDHERKESIIAKEAAGVISCYPLILGQKKDLAASKNEVEKMIRLFIDNGSEEKATMEIDDRWPDGPLAQDVIMAAKRAKSFYFNQKLPEEKAGNCTLM